MQSTGGENLILTDGSIGHFKGLSLDARYFEDLAPTSLLIAYRRDFLRQHDLLGTIYVRPNHQVTVSAALCTTYMQAVGNPGSQCYGSKNKDTYGGRNDLSDSYYDVVPLSGAGT